MRLRYYLLVSSTIPTANDITELIEELQRQLCSGGAVESMSTFSSRDLSLSQVRTLMLLAFLDAPTPINQIAVRLDLTLPSAGRNVERLLREELVERHDDPSDRRVRLVHLTGLGRELVSQHFACHRRRLTAFTDQLSADERIRIASALGPVLERDLLNETTMERPTGALKEYVCPE